MTFYTDLFTPETWRAFVAHGKSVGGFRDRQRRSAERIKPGDVFVCYMVRLSRWCGLLRSTSPMYVDNAQQVVRQDAAKVGCTVLAAALLVGGCEVPMSPVSEDASGKQFAPPAVGKAALYVYRDPHLATFYTVEVSAGRYTLGDLGVSTYLRTELEPGRYDVRCRSPERTDAKVINLQSGEIAFVRIQNLPFGQRCGIALPDAATGRLAVLNSKRVLETQ